MLALALCSALAATANACFSFSSNQAPV